MYYREKLINGVLYCQRKPNGDWYQVDIKVMSARIMEQKEVIANLQSIIEEGDL